MIYDGGANPDDKGAGTLAARREMGATYFEEEDNLNMVQVTLRVWGLI